MDTQFSLDMFPTEPDEPLLDGTWERKNRSPNTAAVAALLGIGAIYFNAQSILVTIAVFAKTLALHRPIASGGFLDRMADIMEFSAGPVQLTLVVTEFVFMLFPALWVVRHWHSSAVWDYIRLKRSSSIEVLLAVLATLALIPAVDSVANFLTNLMHVPERLKEINAVIFTARSPQEFI